MLKTDRKNHTPRPTTQTQTHTHTHTHIHAHTERQKTQSYTATHTLLNDTCGAGLCRGQGCQAGHARRAGEDTGEYEFAWPLLFHRLHPPALSLQPHYPTLPPCSLPWPHTPGPAHPAPHTWPRTHNLWSSPHKNDVSDIIKQIHRNK